MDVITRQMTNFYTQQLKPPKGPEDATEIRPLQSRPEIMKALRALDAAVHQRP
jgi:hypothetical protein